MKKKALLYVMPAILLGTVTMDAPLMRTRMHGVKNMSAILETLGEGEETYGEREALERALVPSNVISAELMLVPSFLLALGVSILLKKRVGATYQDSVC